MAKKGFIRTLLIITGIYCIWMLGAYFSKDAIEGRSDTDIDMSYSDLSAAYKKLQQQLQNADSTNIIRRYHGRYALFDAQDVFDDKTMALTRDHFTSSKGKDSLYLDAPELSWKHHPDARPVDAMRLTFRGNGIPNNVEKLAKSGLMAPRMHAFYNALIEKNTALWTKEDAAISFDVRTPQDEIYRAKSTPFIAIQRLTKDDLAKMKAASLPFLWKAYIDEEKEKASQQALLVEAMGPPDLIGPYLPAEMMPNATNAPVIMGPRYPRTQADMLRTHLILQATPESQGPLIPALGAGSVLEALPGLTETIMNAPNNKDHAITQPSQPSVSGFALDESKMEELLEKSLFNDSMSLTETLEMKKAINNQHRKGDSSVSQHIEQLARLDPEFTALFLINNMFEQYNIFSVFEDDVYLTINALDTRLNVLYVSYDMRFDPPKQLDLDEAIQAGCSGNPVHISDEFFLIAAKPYSYLIRVYLPSCLLDEGDYDEVDLFLEELRILH